MDATICNLAQIEKLPVTTVQIRQAIQKDVVLSKVYAAWMAKASRRSSVPYWNRSQQLLVEDGCLLLGPRVIVPAVLKKQVY